MRGRTAWLLAAGLLLGSPTDARAQDDVARPADDALTLWARTGDAQKNRVLDTALSAEVTGELLAVLARGVSPCDCFVRRVRWAWALPSPKSREHPAVVVAFTDPPRIQDRVVAYVRLAYLRFVDGRYVVTSSMALKRPSPAQPKASLDVRLVPRDDVDEDDQLDIALRFAERWPRESFCGRATFASSADQLVIEEEACGDEAPASPAFP